jgi:hypothetical protein
MIRMHEIITGVGVRLQGYLRPDAPFSFELMMLCGPDMDIFVPRQTDSILCAWQVNNPALIKICWIDGLRYRRITRIIRIRCSYLHHFSRPIHQGHKGKSFHNHMKIIVTHVRPRNHR